MISSNPALPLCTLRVTLFAPNARGDLIRDCEIISPDGEPVGRLPICGLDRHATVRYADDLPRVKVELYGMRCEVVYDA